MNYQSGALRWMIAFVAAYATAAPPLASPSFENEQLHYNVNWPSGLNLGEATFSASSSKPAPDTPSLLHFSFHLDAPLPGFAVADHYDSAASPDFCSTHFERNISRGAKQFSDKTSFDPRTATAFREIAGGGKGEFRASECAHDALTFLYYVRRELSEGRMPAPQSVVFGGSFYDVRLEPAGTESIPVAGNQLQADHFKVSVRGPASSTGFDIFFLKDSARTPALVRVPFSLGAFSMELVK